MKSVKFLLLTGLLICLSVGFLANNDNSNQKELNFNARKYIEKWVKFWNIYDLNMIEKLFLKGSNLTYFSSEKQGLIKGFENVVKHHERFGFVKGGRKPSSSLWVEDIHCENFQKTAVVTGVWYFKKSNRKIQKGPMTVVYVAKNDQYKIAHMNFSNYESEDDVNRKILPYNIPVGVQGISLTGGFLSSSKANKKILEKYQEFKMIYDANPDKPENIIWYGRWTAYKGDYRGAIKIYTEGIAKYPKDARFYRHRGHRYISIRLFDLAVKDFNQAALLIQGKKDQIEPDGMPNVQNIPVSTLHTNIYYHLGLAHYLLGDYQSALVAYNKGIKASNNDDNIVSTTHWLYMALRLMGKEKEAKEALKLIKIKMDIIENIAYHNLCLFYKGEIAVGNLMGEGGSAIMNDAVAYGLGNWYLYNNQPKKAQEIFKKILKGKVWTSFGYIAAEADYVRNFRK